MKVAIADINYEKASCADFRGEMSVEKNGEASKVTRYL